MTEVNPKQRFAYIDWLRGLACLMMFIVHGYDSWLRYDLRETSTYKWSQFLGTIPAPLFLFLAGVALALVTDKMRRAGASANEIARKSIARGAEVVLFGYLFRIQEYVLGLPKAPWTDLLRVDILTTIGITLILMGVICWLARSRAAMIALSVTLTFLVAMVTPPLYTTWRPRWLPWFLESYVNGVHIYNVPQAWLFPIFPWVAFGFAGLAIGFLLFSDWGTAHLWSALLWMGAAGGAIVALAVLIDARGPSIYASYDFWHTSPNFFFARVGVMMAMMPLGYVWCRWGPGENGFSPLVQMGKTSLLVYWVHIVFVYGRLSILPKHKQGSAAATLGIAIIFIAMTLLSMARTHYDGRIAEVRERFLRRLGISAR
jgi:uncharacterized membrane protein